MAILLEMCRKFGETFERDCLYQFIAADTHYLIYTIFKI